MEGLVSGWFMETWKGLITAVEVEKVLVQEKSKYQDILLFKSTKFGNVLVLDGIIQCTERDEFVYHEMMAHLPLFSHPNPKKVLIVGGGDGGVLREVAKHDGVEEIHQCEIDERVIEISKQYLPSIAIGYESPKLTVHIEDVTTFIDNHINEYDVIIVDSSDYDRGPSQALYEKPFYDKINRALKDDGIVCSLADCVWTDLDFIQKFMGTLRNVFPVVNLVFEVVLPTYIGGQVGLMLSSKNKDISFENPVHSITDEEVKEMNLRYYNREMHKACLVLPQFVKDALANDSSSTA